MSMDKPSLVNYTGYVQYLYANCINLDGDHEKKASYVNVSRVFKSGPTWARTKDPLIMSQVL